MKFFGIIGLLVTFFSGLAQEPFSENGKYGFRFQGKTIYPAELEYASHFSEGLACVKMNGKWGYLDSLGNWAIQSQYDKAQPFKDGSAKVIKNGKKTIINKKGTSVIPDGTIYYEHRQGAVLFKAGDKVGASRDEWATIPPKYKDIWYDDKLAYAKVADRKYDIYDQNGLLFSDQQGTFYSWEINQENARVVQVNGKYGVYHKNGYWIIKPTFDYIDQMPTTGYKEIDSEGNETEFTRFYALYQSIDTNQVRKSPDSKEYRSNANNLEFARNCKLSFVRMGSLTPIVEDITGFKLTRKELSWRVTDYSYKIYQGELQGLIDVNLEVTPAKYLSITNLDGNYSIYEQKDEATLQDISGNTVLKEKKIHAIQFNRFVFDAPSGEVYSIDDTLEGSLVQVYSAAATYLYDIYRQIPVTPMLSLGTSWQVLTNDYDLEIAKDNYCIKYTFEDKVGFITDKMNQGSSLKYSCVYPIYETPYYFVAEDDKLEYLLEPAKNLDPIAQAENFMWSKDLGREDYGYNDDGYFAQEVFTQPFILSQNKGKYGAVFYNGYVLEPIYDTIIEDAELSEFYHLKTGDKWSALYHPALFDDYSNEFSELPIYKTKLMNGSVDSIHQFIKLDYGFPNLFAKVVKNDKEIYYGFDGNFYISLDMYVYPIADEESGFWGLASEEEGQERMVVEPKYSYVEESEYINLFIAHGAKKTRGVINNFGDTVVPFNYTKISYPELEVIPEAFYDGGFFGVSNKKKYGLYHTVYGEIIPCEASYIESAYTEDKGDYQYDGIYIVEKKNKMGAYSFMGKQILPFSFKEIMPISYEIDYNKPYLIVTNSKNKKGMVSSINGDTIVPIEYDNLDAWHSEYQDVGYDVFTLELSLGNKKGLLCVNKKIIPALYTDISASGESEYLIYHCFSGNGIALYDYAARSVLPLIEDEITFEVIENDLCVAKAKSGSGYLANAFRNGDSCLNCLPFSDAMSYQWVSKQFGYVLADNVLIKKDVVTTKEVDRKPLNEAVIEGAYFNLYFENGKMGAKDKAGNILVPAIYDTADFMTDREEVMIAFENGVQYYVYVDSNERYTEEEW